MDEGRLRQDEEHVKGEEETMGINNLFKKFDCEGKK